MFRKVPFFHLIYSHKKFVMFPDYPSNSKTLIILSILLFTLLPLLVHADDCCMVEFTAQDYPSEASPDNRKISTYQNPPFNQIQYNVESGNFYLTVTIQSYASAETTKTIFDEDVQFLQSDASDWKRINQVIEDFSGFFGYALTRDNRRIYIMESMYGECNIIRIRTDVLGKTEDQLDVDEVWVTREQAMRMLLEKCPLLSVTHKPLYIGALECCYLGVAGGSSPYYAENITTHHTVFLSTRALEYYDKDKDIFKNFFVIRGVNTGETSFEITDSSNPERTINVPVHVIEAMYPSLRENLVLYLPYVTYVGNTYQVLLDPVSIESLIFKLGYVASREEYKGCGRAPSLDETTLDLYVPCMLYESKFYNFTMRFISADPVEFVLDPATFREVDPFYKNEDFQLCFPGAFGTIPVAPLEANGPLYK